MCSSFFCGLLKPDGNNRPSSRHIASSFPLKILLVGDSGTGKTKLVRQYTENTYKGENEDELTELHRCCVIQNGETVPIVIYDTPAGDTGEHKNMYSNADVIILCIDVCNKRTLVNIQERWIPELHSVGCAKNFEFMLVGTKMDDRRKHETRDSRHGREGNTVSKEDGLIAQKTLRSLVYLECSARTGEGVKKVFEVATLLAHQRRIPRKSFIKKFSNWNSVSFKNGRG